MVLEILGKPDSLIQYVGDRPGQVTRHISSTEKAVKVLGIKPGRPFQEGLQETIRWYENNQDWWEPLEWMKNVLVRTPSGNVERH
jgi:dTDP-glucose 4,6-dehydratase